MLALKKKNKKYNSIPSNLKRSKKCQGICVHLLKSLACQEETWSQTSAMMIHSPIVQSNSLLSISDNLGWSLYCDTCKEKKGNEKPRTTTLPLTVLRKLQCLELERAERDKSSALIKKKEKKKKWHCQKPGFTTSFMMLPWRRASMCNRDNSWGMKALRRGRVTSGIQITDNSRINPSISQRSATKSHKRMMTGKKREPFYSENG